jgi:hypothetical protein
MILEKEMKMYVGAGVKLHTFLISSPLEISEVTTFMLWPLNTLIKVKLN